MDPLSLAASTAALLSRAAALSSTLYTWLRAASTEGASPKIFKPLTNELDQLRLVLSEFEKVLTDGDASRRSSTYGSGLLTAFSSSDQALRDLHEKLSVFSPQISGWQGLGRKYHLRTSAYLSDDLERATMAIQQSRSTLILIIDTTQTYPKMLETRKATPAPKEANESCHPRLLSENETTLSTTDSQQDMLSWLTCYDYQRRHEDLQKQRTAGTGSTYLQAKEFKNWTRSRPLVNDDSNLWLRGKPGSGKSVAMSAIVDHLHTSFNERSDIGIAYFYFKCTTVASPRDVVASLLKQLCLRSKSVPGPVAQLWDHREIEDFPKLLDLMSALLSVCSRFRRSFLCIDALDECAHEHQAILQEVLRKLKMSRYRLLITSRPLKEIEDIFHDVPQLDISATLASKDIDLYVKSVIQTRPDFWDLADSGLQDTIREKLVDRANGMFWWASLQMNDILDQTTIKQVKASLEEMPQSLESVYERILFKIQEQPKQKSRLAMSIFMWLLCAAKPLTIDELQQALAIDFDSHELDLENISPAKYIEGVCMGLVHIDESRYLILPSHLSVMDYLKKNGESLFGNGTEKVAKTCIAYLKLNEFNTGASKTNQEIEKRVSSYPFSIYAAQHWGAHARECWKNDIPDQVRELLANQERLACLSQLMYLSSDRLVQRNQPYPAEMSGLHFAAYFGLYSTMKETLETPTTVSCVDSWGRTPLHLAANQGHLDEIRLLLESGVNVSHQDKFGKTALHYGAASGRRVVVEELLRNGSDTSIADLEGKISLEYAVSDGHVEVVTALLESGTKLNHALKITASIGHAEIMDMLLSYGAEPEDDNAMHEAAKKGFEDIVRALFEHGADIDHKDQEGMTALHHAAFYGHIATVEHLLINGANIQSQDKQGRTPLFLASEKGDETTVKKLIDFGAQLEYQTNEGATALTMSASHGKTDVVEILLRKGARIDSASSSESSRSLGSSTVYAENALQAASRNGHEAVVKLLLKVSQDVNARGSTDRASLSYAASNGHIEVMKLLLNRGADPNAADSNMRTPLSYSAENGHLKATELLLDSGADINIRDDLGRTALSYASSNGHIPAINILLRCGAGVNIADNDSRTALSYASLNNHSQATKILLENGAEVNTTENFGRTTLSYVP